MLCPLRIGPDPRGPVDISPLPLNHDGVVAYSFVFCAFSSNFEFTNSSLSLRSSPDSFQAVNSLQ